MAGVSFAIPTPIQVVYPMPLVRDGSLRSLFQRCLGAFMRIDLSRFRSIGVACIASGLIVSCAGLKERSVTARETDLAAGGFILKPANSPERQDMLQRL